MKVGVIAVFCFFLTTVFGFSAPGETDPVARAEVSKLAFLTGKWAARGWIMGRDRQKAEFDQTEDIHFKLDNSILLIEGREIPVVSE